MVAGHGVASCGFDTAEMGEDGTDDGGVEDAPARSLSELLSVEETCATANSVSPADMTSKSRASVQLADVGWGRSRNQRSSLHQTSSSGQLGTTSCSWFF